VGDAGFCCQDSEGEDTSRVETAYVGWNSPRISGRTALLFSWFVFPSMVLFILGRERTRLPVGS
jgi:hypothetical protein